LLELSQGLFGITVRTVLNVASLLAASLNQRLTLLLRLLTELQCILVQSLRFSLGFLLQPKAFNTDLFEFLE
tara:strand:- start:533 stop:748 length:216 start_codon:yes stop_codon:yes gene_type:complete